MIQQYLLENKTDKNSILKMKNKSMRTKQFSIDKGNSLFVQFELDGENEKTARIMSDLHSKVVEKYKVSILYSGCSQYFNKHLYPLINEFECQLRKFLKISNATRKDEKTEGRISSIEKMEFGQLFAMLFVDDSFMNRTKEEIKKRNNIEFSKEEIIHFIQSFKENPFWDREIGRDVVPSLRNNYISVRELRNDVMHSHNTSWESYRKGKALLGRINNEISKAITKEEKEVYNAEEKEAFNSEMDVAIQSIHKRVEEYSQPVIDSMRAIAELSNLDAVLPSSIQVASEWLAPETRALRLAGEQIIAASNIPYNAVMEFLKEQDETLKTIREGIAPVTEMFKKYPNIRELFVSNDELNTDDYSK